MDTIETQGPDASDTPKMMRVIEEELDCFDEWFQSEGNERLVRSEKAILRTYLAAKLTKRIP